MRRILSRAPHLSLPAVKLEEAFLVIEAPQNDGRSFEASKPISYQDNKAVSNLGDILFFSLSALRVTIQFFFVKCTQAGRNGLLFCDDALFCVLSFACKNSYLLWAVLEYFSESRNILQREEKVKERVSNKLQRIVLRFNKYFLHNQGVHSIFRHSCFCLVHCGLVF